MRTLVLLELTQKRELDKTLNMWPNSVYGLTQRM